MPKLTTITLGNLDRLSIDEQERLYWDGREILTDMKLTLPWWANVAVVTVAVVTVLNWLGVTPDTLRSLISGS